MVTSARDRRPRGFAVLAVLLGWAALSGVGGLLVRGTPSGALDAVYMLAAVVDVLLALIAGEALWKCRSNARDAMSAFAAAVVAKNLLGLWLEDSLTAGAIVATLFSILLFVVLPLVYVNSRSEQIFGRPRRVSP
jgi:hypothetical protein